VTVVSPPLAQWQIDHIRKMKAELGLPQEASDAEEVTMDEELDEDTMGALPSEANAADATAGGLSVYKDPNVQSAMTSFNKLAAEQTARYDAMEKALKEKRYGPSFSERMFQLSAALAAPTSRRGFGGVLENITPVLAAQQKAQREGEMSRREALEQLDKDRFAQRLGLAKQDVTTALAMAKLAKQGVGSSVTYAPDRKGFVNRPGVGGNAPMPQMNQFGYYVITDPRQLVYLPPNTPVVYPDGDQTKPRFTPANPTGEFGDKT